MKGTKLWYAPGSPLIQGRSRRERSLSQDVVVSGIIAAVVTALIYVVSARVYHGDMLSLAWLSMMGAVGIGIAGAAAGVLLAKAFGWYPRWISGVVVGTASAVLSYLLLGS